MNHKPDLQNANQIHEANDGQGTQDELGYQNLCTNDKILQVAVDLMSDKGYKTVTTKEIALEAGVSEMTLFRHFGCKLKILEDAIDKFSCSAPMKQLFDERLQKNLEADLLEISRTYQQLMDRNKKIMLISVKDGNNIPMLKDQLSIYTDELRDGLINYFSQMQQLGKVVESDPETLALAFLSMNFGAFFDNILKEADDNKLSREEHIESGVRIFARGLTP